MFTALTYGREHFSRKGQCEVSFEDEPVAEPAAAHGYDPHGDVRYGRQYAVRRNVVMQNLVHVNRQICDHREETPVVADLGRDQGP